MLPAASDTLRMQAMARDKSFYADIACRDMKGAACAHDCCRCAMCDT